MINHPTARTLRRRRMFGGLVSRAHMPIMTSPFSAWSPAAHSDSGNLLDIADFARTRSAVALITTARGRSAIPSVDLEPTDTEESQVTREPGQLVVRIWGDAIARQPVRLGGFQLLGGAALLMMETTHLPIPYGVGMVMSVAAGVAIVAAVVWYAAQRS